MGKLRHPNNINQPVQEAATAKTIEYLADYANNRYIFFLPAVFSTSGRIDEEFLRLIFYHAHREPKPTVNQTTARVRSSSHLEVS